MKKLEIRNSEGEIIKYHSPLPGKFQDAPGSSIISFVLQFISRHVDRMRSIENQAYETDLKNFVRETLEFREAAYVANKEINLAKVERLHKKGLSDENRLVRIGELEQLEKVALAFENQYLQIMHSNLPKFSKDLLISKWHNRYKLALTQQEAIYR